MRLNIARYFGLKGAGIRVRTSWPVKAEGVAIGSGVVEAANKNCSSRARTT